MGAVYDRSLLFEDLLKFADVLFQFSGRYAFFHTEGCRRSCCLSRYHCLMKVSQVCVAVCRYVFSGYSGTRHRYGIS